MNIEEFKQQNSQQIKKYPLALQALWYDYQDDWHKSHKLIDTESDILNKFSQLALEEISNVIRD